MTASVGVEQAGEFGEDDMFDAIARCDVLDLVELEIPFPADDRGVERILHADVLVATAGSTCAFGNGRPQNSVRNVVLFWRFISYFQTCLRSSF